MTTVSVVIGTYGDDIWKDRADEAMKSVLAQTVTVHDAIAIHGPTLAQARNMGAERVSGDWLVFLDADDALDPKYVEAMKVTMAQQTGPALLQPSTIGVYPDGREDDKAVLIPQRSLDTGNFMVIGTAIRRDQFQRLGGFKEWPMYEDWCLWIRAWQDGAALVPCADAIYRVTVNEGSRNKATRKEQIRTFNLIRSEYFE